jgi:hypothetical protein
MELRLNNTLPMIGLIRKYRSYVKETIAFVVESSCRAPTEKK